MLRNYYQGTMITVELPKNQYKVMWLIAYTDMSRI